MENQVQAAPTPPRKIRSGPRFDVWALLPFALFVVLYFAVPHIIPGGVRDKWLGFLVDIGIAVLLALGLNLLMGYAGQISLGHAAFYGLGAYTSAILTLQPIQKELIPGFGVGIGVMAGVAAVMSLTRASGWRLACAVAVLIALSWICRIANVGLPGVVAIYAIGMALLGLALRLGWWKPALAGVISVAAGVVVRGFLTHVLDNSMNGVPTSPWAGMLAGVLITGLIAYLIGALVLELKGNYLAMATLGFGIIVEIVFTKWVAVTGGSSDGIYGIPPIQFVDNLPKPLKHVFGAGHGASLSPQHQYYYLVWMFVFFALLLAVNIVRSRVGRAFRAVHGSEQAAQSLGVDTGRYKVQVFVVAAALASIAGTLHAHNASVGYIGPRDFGFDVSVQLVVIVVIGGLASVWGALLGATTIELLKYWIMMLDKSGVSLFGFAIKGIDPIVFGGILIVVMMVMPQGLARGLSESLSAALRGAIGAAGRKAG